MSGCVKTCSDVVNEVLAEVRQAKAAVDYAYNRRMSGLIVYMGPDKYQPLLAIDLVTARRLPMPKWGGLHLTGPEGEWTIYGMELVLVPWMRGMLVVPDMMTRDDQDPN